ncbi:MAG: hypothetical protein ER33_08680 [Cyanobium sp. CACIAM 14]|nr:MAG: hypothetical protein ER33_08680 [Cyanobium sp. CACIAM 14]
MTIERAQATPLFRSFWEERIEVPGWSEADELADLDTVWASLCQEAAAPRPAGQGPERPSIAAVAVAGLSLSATRRNRLRPAVLLRHGARRPDLLVY